VKYFIFIDESGSFDEGITRKASSLVGGICSTLDDQAWKALHVDQLSAFNSNSRIKFIYPDHYHCGKLLEGHLRVAGPVSRRDLEAFTNAVFTGICGSSAFFFASRNTGKRFETSPQATYVLNLVAATRKALETLFTRCPNADSVEIMVAQRTIAETINSNYPDYMPRLLDYIKDQILSGDSPAISFTRRLNAENRLLLRWGIGDRNPGLIAADFVCCLLRGGKKTPDGTIVERTNPDEFMFGDYRRHYDHEVARLLENKQYATTADYLRRYLPTTEGHPDYSRLIQALKREDDSQILMRETSALLAYTRFLIASRTREPGNLDGAKKLLHQLTDIAEANLRAKGSIENQRVWANYLADGLSDLAACHNHQGNVNPQKDIETRLTTLLQQQMNLLPGTHNTRKERLLEIRNRNLNYLFNDYRFEEVLTTFSDDVDRREAEVPADEPDELLGQMQGSLGQACAFLARTDPAWGDMARAYFEKSIKHFPSGISYYSMSANYLATLAWQSDDLNRACAEMNRHSGNNPVATPADLVSRLPEIMTTPNLSPFNAINYLRIASAHCDAVAADVIPIDKNMTAAIWDTWKTRIFEDHPCEHLCKWIGYLFLQAQQYESATQILAQGVSISKKLHFTVQTIGLSQLGLITVINKIRGDNQSHAKHFQECLSWTESLIAQSTPFASYLKAWGGIDQFSDILKGSDISSASDIARLLPFNYS
jgi:hypothetical protein